ncbi:MAG: choice-of-anchor J domain-containing protein [Gelidibacter sp.]
MKKITFLMFAVFAFCWQSNAQYFTDSFETDLSNWSDVAGATDSGGNLWVLSTSLKNTGLSSVFFDDYNGDNDRWLISSAIDLSSATSPIFTYFDNVNYATYADVNEVLYSTDYAGDPNTATWNTLNDVIGTEDTWVQNGPYSLPTSSTVYIAFHYVGNYASEWYIDDVLVTEAPTCTQVVVDSSTVVDDCGNSQFSVDVDVTSVGDGTFITDGLGGSFAITSGVVTAGPYATGSTVTLTVEHSDSACNFSLGDFSTGCTLPGAVCGNAVILTPGTPQNGATTTGAGSFSDNNTAPNINPCSTNYNDLEYWFEYTAVTTGETLDITVTNITTNYYGVFILDNCPDSAPSCVAQDTNSSSTADLMVTTPGLTAGTTYYIVVTDWAEGPTTFTMNSVVNAAPTCTNATVAYAVESDCDTSGGFFVNVDVTNMGTATALTVSDDQGSATQPLTAIGTLQFGPYANGTDVVITVTDDNDATCEQSSIALTQTACPPANDECATAEAIVCGNTVTGSTQLATNTGYSNGNDVWYFLAGTQNGSDITISLCGSSFDTTLRVFDACGGNQVAFNDDASGVCSPQSEVTFTSDGVSTYYILVDGYYAGGGDFTLNVTCTEPPTCTNATVAYTVASNCDVSESFFVNVDVTNMGTATALTVSDDQGSATQPLTAIGTLQFGPYANGTDVVITVTDDNDATCEQSSNALTQTACPPANDDVSGAIGLTVGNTLCEETFTGTNIGATTSAEVSPTCGTSNFGGDVWFKVAVPPTGMLTIETSDVDGTIADTVMEIYSGSSGNLTSLGCFDDISYPSNAFSMAELTDLNPGDILLVRVWEYQNNTKGNFNICAWSPTSLGTTDFAFDNFSYYPNPVKETLTLNSPKGIDAVTIFNIIGQRIVNINSNATVQNIDMSTLQAGTYIVKVKIDDQTKIIRVVKE